MPKLDLRDGTINLPGVTPSGQGTVLDITQYEEGPNEPNEPIEQLCIYNCDPMNKIQPEAQLKNGQVTIHITEESMEQICQIIGRKSDDCLAVTNAANAMRSLSA